MSSSPPFDFSFAPIAGVSQSTSGTPSPLEIALNALAPLPDLTAPLAPLAPISTTGLSVGQPLTRVSATGQVGAGTGGSVGLGASLGQLAPLLAAGALLVGLAMVIGRPSKRPPPEPR